MMFSRDLGVKFLKSGVNLKIMAAKRPKFLFWPQSGHLFGNSATNQKFDSSISRKHYFLALVQFSAIERDLSRRFCDFSVSRVKVERASAWLRRQGGGSDLKILTFFGTDIECSKFYVLSCPFDGNSKYSIVFQKIADMRVPVEVPGGQFQIKLSKKGPFQTIFHQFSLFKSTSID